MSVLAPPMPMPLPEPIYRISVEQFWEMVDKGIFKDGERVELLEGILVPKMTEHMPHRFASQLLKDILIRLAPAGWFVDSQAPLPTTDSVPEPDVMVIRGDRRAYLAENRHPGPEDMGLVVEVSDTSVRTDRGTKRRIYARANVAQYWIVNVVDRRVEVYTDPSGPGDDPAYRQQRDHGPGDEVPVLLDGQEVGRVRVNDLF
jgi:Uma2 family endonuclease